MNGNGYVLKEQKTLRKIINVILLTVDLMLKIYKYIFQWVIFIINKLKVRYQKKLKVYYKYNK